MVPKMGPRNPVEEISFRGLAGGPKKWGQNMVPFLGPDLGCFWATIVFCETFWGCFSGGRAAAFDCVFGGDGKGFAEASGLHQRGQSLYSACEN